jgi:hypothetical protein
MKIVQKKSPELPRFARPSANCKFRRGRRWRRVGVVSRTLTPAPLPSDGRGVDYCGGVTQGGARSSLALGWYMPPLQGFGKGKGRACLAGSLHSPRSRGRRAEGGGKGREVRGQRPEVRGQRPEVRGQRPEVRGQRPEVRCQRPEVRCQRLEGGGGEPIENCKLQIANCKSRRGRRRRRAGVVPQTLTPAPLPSDGRGDDYCGGVTQGDARSSLAGLVYVALAGLWEGEGACPFGRRSSRRWTLRHTARVQAVGAKRHSRFPVRRYLCPRRELLGFPLGRTTANPERQHPGGTAGSFETPTASFIPAQGNALGLSARDHSER